MALSYDFPPGVQDILVQEVCYANNTSCKSFIIKS